MEAWMNLPWWARMILSVTVIGLGVAFFFWVMSGTAFISSRRGGPLMLPGLVVLLGLIMLASSFPYDRGKYRF